jgi:arylsulfatase
MKDHLMAAGKLASFSLALGMAVLPPTLATASTAAKKPNMLVIWGDDIGTTNISFNNRGLMGYRTPNIDRIAQEGVSFTDYYGQQSCTAGRAAFLAGNNPLRTGMTKVGVPSAPWGWQKSDVTLATILKSQGYATGQFGKNHLGDRDEHLPTMHGFDEFLGNLYHLNAEEEPEHEDYPRNPGFRKQFGPRGVIKSTADGKGGQTVVDTGPLIRKRMETIDDETIAATRDFITRQVKAGKPFFAWWNGTRMHLRTHVRADRRHPGNDEYTDGMIEHDGHVGELLKLLDDLGVANDTIVLYSTDNGPHFNTWPDAGNTPFRSEKNSNWEGAYRVPAFVRWPGHFPAGVTLNGIVAHEDWMPTFAAVAGMPDIAQQLRKGGVALNGRTYRSAVDGFNMLDYLSGKATASPRGSFIYVNDDGDIVAVRVRDWKVVYKENRGEAFGVWREPFTTLRVPLIFNLRRDPYERAQHNANTYDDWLLDRATFVVSQSHAVALQFLTSFKEFPPSQTPGSFNLDSLRKKIESAGSREE